MAPSDGYVMPAGWAPVGVAAAPGKPTPWLEVQFMTEGKPIRVGTK